MEASMSRGMPSMVALLGLLAVAGYQNRDKLAEMIRGKGQNASGQGGQPGGLGGILGSLGNLFEGSNPNNVVNDGLGGLVDRFKQNGQGGKAESWVKTGPNEAISPEQLERAIGPDVLDTLVKQTGLSRDELLARLSRTLPDAVDKYTPEGTIPVSQAA
jgi:uncharacterized protein YidB (DUF937 family)